MVAPIIPALNDTEIERILDAAAAAGAREAGYVLLRLPLEVRDLFREWLMAQLPRPLPPRVHADPRRCAAARTTTPKWGKRMTGTGPYRLDDRPALRDRLRAARPQPAQAEAHDRAFTPTRKRAAAAGFVVAEARVTQSRRQCRNVLGAHGFRARRCLLSAN